MVSKPPEVGGPLRCGVGVLLSSMCLPLDPKGEHTTQAVRFKKSGSSGGRFDKVRAAFADHDAHLPFSGSGHRFRARKGREKVRASCCSGFDKVRAVLADHDARRVGIAADEPRHDGRIGDAQAFDTAGFELSLIHI